ncbi:MAG: hypothetical protein WCF08_10890 [Anaerolineaceae bacterium]
MSINTRIVDINSTSDLEGIAVIVNQFDQPPSSPEDIRRILTYLPPGRITDLIPLVPPSWF